MGMVEIRLQFAVSFVSDKSSDISSNAKLESGDVKGMD